ncbi:hypothetical protein L1O03_08305 [Corynebacterium uropygiale]|uniref:Uncharacterized protein n=1 Tax=Corynebacterium uropygiale TaxID=1775911 RepID=A0A9X1U146_9CORY|nr:hypothetical protein [Corynebacterium uropygiale]MCF4007173.1 hypothetical protein [Corynebacterium uropygiale]
MNNAHTASLLNVEGILDATLFRSLLDAWQPPGRDGLFVTDPPSEPEEGLVSRVLIYREEGVSAHLATFTHALTPESCDMDDGWSRNEDFSRGDGKEELLLVGNSSQAGSLRVEFVVERHEDFVRVGEVYDTLVDLLLAEVSL